MGVQIALMGYINKKGIVSQGVKQVFIVNFLLFLIRLFLEDIANK